MNTINPFYGYVGGVRKTIFFQRRDGRVSQLGRDTTRFRMRMMVLLLAWLMFDNLISALRVFGVSAGYSRKAVRRTVHVKSLCGAGRDQSLSLCRHSGSC